jgi:two-component sensor histidine kinase/tetratricopeptide (TPR) repeat protein
VQTKLPIASYLVILLLTAFSVSATAQSALDNEIDSLQRAIAKAPPDTSKTILQLSLLPRLYTRYLLGGNLASDSLAFCKTINDCRSLSIQLKDSYARGTTYLWDAYFFNLLSDHPKRDALLNQGFSIFRSTNDKKGLANAHFFKAELRSGIETDSAKLLHYDSSILLAREAGDLRKQAQAMRAAASMHQRLGNNPHAIELLLQALELQKKIGDNRTHFTTDALAQAYAWSRNHKEGLRYAISSVDLSRENKDTAMIVTFYQRLAFLYYSMNNFDKSYFYFDKALSAYKPGASELNTIVSMTNLSGKADCLIRQGKHQQAWSEITSYLKEHPVKDERLLDYLHFTFLTLFYDQGEFRKAEAKLLQLMSHRNDWDFVKRYMILVHTKAGQVYLHLRQPDKAALYADSAYIAAEMHKSYDVMRDNSLTLYQVDSMRGDHHSAMKHYVRYKEFSDSVQKDISDRSLAELSVRYETDQKNAELSTLANRTRLQQETIQQSGYLRNAMIGGSALLLLLLLVTWNRFRVKKKANLLLQQKQEEINWQNTVLEKMIADEKKITEEKDKLLVEKEWLMKEINHRVKNNLQVVMSLLNTQSSYLKDEAALNAIHESRHRVHAISLIHRKLYQSDQLLTVIDMGTYIKEVVEYLSDNLDTGNSIAFGLFIDPISLDVTQAVPTGLIINEAVTNAVKYAFPGNSKGQINICMYKNTGGVIELLISDNGIGLPGDFDWRNTDSLGMSLMNGLSRQLDGTFEVVQQNGLTIKINFERSKSTAQ